MIRSNLLFIFCALSAITVASTASAGLIAYEPFDYNTGSLLGQTNPSTGNSWLRAGTSANPTAINVVSGNLNVPPEMLPPLGNSLAITGIGDGSGASERLALGQT